MLTFYQGTRIRVVRIKALDVRRGSASDAALLYDDLSPVEQARKNIRRATIQKFESREGGGGRPTKRQRRETDRLKFGFLDGEDEYA